MTHYTLHIIPVFSSSVTTSCSPISMYHYSDYQDTCRPALAAKGRIVTISECSKWLLAINLTVM